MKDTNQKTAPDETMIPDARAGLSPRDMVEGKLLHVLRAHPWTPCNGTHENASRRPARAAEK
jgi:hypothetical protein